MGAAAGFALGKLGRFHGLSSHHPTEREPQGCGYEMPSSLSPGTGMEVCSSFSLFSIYERPLGVAVNARSLKGQ